MLPTVDWTFYFRPAVLALLNGGDPYAVPVFNPPWVFAPLIPFALLPEPFSSILRMTITVLCFGFIIYRLGGRRIALIAVLSSPLVLDSLVFGNVEWLTFLGLVVTPWVGLILLALKPQITFVAIALVAYQNRKNPIVFVPLTVVSCVSFLMFGPWPIHIFGYGDYAGGFNTGLFPLSIVFALPLAYRAIRGKRLEDAIAASPLFAPTLSQTAWAGLPLALVRYPSLATLSTIALWICVAINGSIWRF